MKRHLYILYILLVATQVVCAGTKLNPDIRHFITVSGSLGCSSLLNNTGTVKAGVGVTPALGVGYRLCYNDLVIQTGVEAHYDYINNRLPNTQMSLKMADTEDDPFILEATLNDGKDIAHNVSAVVPILIGYEHRQFFCLAGAELAYSLYALTSSTALLSTRANYYDYFMDDFQNMPNHQLYEDQTTASGNMSLQFNATVYAHLEAGLRLGKIKNRRRPEDKEYRMYLSLFADYGLLNIHQNKANGDMASYRETSEGVQFYVMPAMVSNELLNAKVNPLTIGIKFTAAFELPHSKTWRIYDATENKAYNRVQGKSQAIREE